ncbi:MAG: aspartate carbamoyltransferase catalytic subunit [Candidatus Hydrogenedentota bacterium]|nr:MAG: aspartate carbamoyltransferase catalytic subunit [Candidatus Hydrogenedentota bacterium]
MIRLRSRHLLTIEELTHDEILEILDTARGMKEVFASREENTRAVKKVPVLQGRTVVILFFEPSTRTRQSFELAAKRLSADVVTLNIAASSREKGETIIDTVRTLEAMASDIIVVRHRSSGVPRLLSKTVRSSIVNAGDGCHAHPTQALLDFFTMREHLGELKGRKVVIVGDILHSRVARSNIHGLQKLGVKVTLVGPPSLVPREFSRLGVEIEYDFDRALAGADVVMMLRIQKERMMGAFFPSIGEYHRFYGLNRQRLALAKPDCLVMHPGPINRGVEIDSDVADGPQSVICEQVTNGVAVRMAILYLLASRL